jgi:hypothetical protein
MRELLKLYLGASTNPSRAFWVGAARLFDPTPLLSATSAREILRTFPTHDDDDTYSVGWPVASSRFEGR